ncbi:hypothetical protein [Planococcus lenghuensis]|uniref:Uncharacterized protein n=1 Tax=Planococcus lenghuensis TaxID=2213202 RepID=A0A1Q2KYT4_9BACL|nr:hypothetical protein [Planococcus lenghuensis]AQQ53361.1 hypothetical protein B0X71_09915 [Planococcus lenghuensis]
MKSSETTARHIGTLLNMESESTGENYRFSRKRTIEIGEGNLVRTALFNLIISFKDYQDSGVARNEAELYLRIEECEGFLSELLQHEHPLPTDYHQWQEEKADVVCLHIEAIEPPEIFADRLTEAFKRIAD